MMTGVTTDQANDILIAGLSIQSLSFLLFLCILAVFIYRSYKFKPTQEQPKKPDVYLLVVMATTALLVFLKTIFRLAESSDGVFSPLMTSEGLFGGLEAAPVMLAALLWVVCPLQWRLDRMAGDENFKMNTVVDANLEEREQAPVPK